MKVTYRGHLDHLKFDTTSRNVYIFEASNNYTVEALSYQDLYELLAFEGSYDQIVLTEDPMSKTNTRRIPAVSTWELQFGDDFIKRQEDNDLLVKKQRLFFFKNQEYLDRIGNQYATGKLDVLPDNLEADAQAYAQAAVDQEFPPQTSVLQKAPAEVPLAVSEEEPGVTSSQSSAESIQTEPPVVKKKMGRPYTVNSKPV